MAVGHGGQVLLSAAAAALAADQLPDGAGLRDLGTHRLKDLGQVEEGLAKVRQGVDLYQGLKTPPVFWPTLRVLEAGAYAQAGRAEDGLAMIDEALEIAGRGSGTTMLPEFQLFKGDLLLAFPQVDGGQDATARPCQAHAGRDVGRAWWRRARGGGDPRRPGGVRPGVGLWATASSRCAEPSWWHRVLADPA